MDLVKRGLNLNIVIALLGGAILAVMVHFNGHLAQLTTPTLSSWFAHVIGALASLLLIFAIKAIRKNKQDMTSEHSNGKPPFWAYLGGVPGALIVVFSGFTVNSELGLAGTLVLALVGQIIWGVACDKFGWFGVAKRSITRAQVSSIFLILLGSMLIIWVQVKA
ncbi:MAG: DMT family transporter [Parashewanella sp.]